MNKTQFYMNLIAQCDRLVSFVDQSIDQKVVDKSENLETFLSFMKDTKKVMAEDFLKGLNEE